MDAEVEKRFEKIESNLAETAHLVKQIAAAQLRIEQTLQTLLDALVTGRGNGHSD